MSNRQGQSMRKQTGCRRTKLRAGCPLSEEPGFLPGQPNIKASSKIFVFAHHRHRAFGAPVMAGWRRRTIAISCKANTELVGRRWHSFEVRPMDGLLCFEKILSEAPNPAQFNTRLRDPLTALRRLDDTAAIGRPLRLQFRWEVIVRGS